MEVTKTKNVSGGIPRSSIPRVSSRPSSAEPATKPKAPVATNPKPPNTAQNKIKPTSSNSDSKSTINVNINSKTQQQQQQPPKAVDSFIQQDKAARKLTARSPRTTRRTGSTFRNETGLNSTKKKVDVPAIKPQDSNALLTFSSKQAELAQASENKDAKKQEADDSSNHIKAYVRVRPVDAKDQNDPMCTKIMEVEEQPEGSDDDVTHPSIVVDDPRQGVPAKDYAFNDIFNEASTNQNVYETACKPLLDAVMRGFNGTLFAYGQTGTGKTHTMGSMATYATHVGYQSASRGMIPMAIDDLFQRISNDTDHKYKVVFSYVQIYQEDVFDLLCEDSKCTEPVPIREHPSQGVYMEGVSEFVVHNPAEVTTLLTKGRRRLVVAETKMNRHSSRSHALCQLTVECLLENNQKNGVVDRDLMVKGKLTLCDLAGSERIKRTESTGERLSEAQHINSSLHELGNVVSSLANPDQSHIPFRNSSLTRLLQESLGGNCKTSLIVCCSPLMRDQSETKGTLMFGQRAMCVVQNARINVELDYRHLANELAKQLEHREEMGQRLETKLKRKVTALEKDHTKLKDSHATHVDSLALSHADELSQLKTLHKSASKSSSANQRQIQMLEQQLAAKAKQFQATEKKLKENMQQQAMRTAKEMAQRKKGRKEADRAAEEQLVAVQSQNALLQELVQELEENVAILQEEVKVVADAGAEEREVAVQQISDEHTETITSIQHSFEEEKATMETELKESHTTEVAALQALVEQLQSQVAEFEETRASAVPIETQTEVEPVVCIDTQTDAVDVVHCDVQTEGAVVVSIDVQTDAPSVMSIEIQTSEVDVNDHGAQTDAVSSVCVFQQTEAPPSVTDSFQQTNELPTTVDLQIQVDVEDLRRSSVPITLPNEIVENPNFEDKLPSTKLNGGTQVGLGSALSNSNIPVIPVAQETKARKKKCMLCF